MPGYQEDIAKLVAGLADWFTDDRELERGRMTSRLYPYEMLFSPIQAGRLKIKNRIVMGPMGNINMAEETGRPSNKMIEYFIERAKGGVGLICTGLVPVNATTDPSVMDADGLCTLPLIDRHRTKLTSWKNLADGCHAHSARVFIQLTPGFGRVGNPECLIKNHRLPVSASWNRNYYVPLIPCRPLLDMECRKLIKSAGQAAVDARALDFDGVYLHGHEGYLLDQMTSPAFNRRKRGRYADWQAFGIDLIRELRRRCGDDYPIMYRIDLTLAFAETYGDRMNTVKSLKTYRNERSVQMTLDYMRSLVKAGVDLFDVDLGGYDNWWLPHPPYPMPPGAFLAVSRIVKEYFAKYEVKSNLGQEVPIVAVGKLGFPDLAEQALRDGMCDMIMLARPLLADPYWPNKAFADRVKEIVPCIGDQEGCLNQIVKGTHIQCAVNPRTGFEDMIGEIHPTPEPRKIAVVGAGPAGVYCACLAAMRGHDVALYDRGDKAGGNLIPGSLPKIKYEVANFVRYLNDYVAMCSENHGLSVNFKTEVTPQTLKDAGYDVIVTCTGTTPAAPVLNGIDLPHVVQAVDFLKDPAPAEEAERVVVVGGGDVGCEIAYMLAYEKDKRDVTVIEMLPYFMKGSCTANRGFIIHHLELADIKLMNCTRLNKVVEGGVEILRNRSKTVPDPFVTWEPIIPETVENPFSKKVEVEEERVTLPADLVVLAVGARPNDTLYYECVRQRLAAEIHNIGDSMNPAMVLEATKAGYALGTSL
jgi:2-enoate reductase